MSFKKDKISLSGDFEPSIVFLAEGKPERDIINLVLESMPTLSKEDCVIYMLKGLGNLIPKIKQISKEPNFHKVKKIGILVDAEQEPDTRQKQILKGLALMNFPNNIDDIVGSVITNGDKASGFFITPGEEQAGRIEDLVIKELESKAEWACLQIYKDCLKERLGKELDDKSMAQIGVSTMDGSICGLGIAFESGLLDVNHASYEPIVTMVKNLVTK